MMESNQDNIDKNQHGSNGIKALEQMVETLKACDYICDFKRKLRVADPDYGEEQFYTQFLIEFSDKEQWLLHSTTTIRDRIAEQQWHCEQIKRLNEYVKKAYVVVPDELNDTEKKIAESYDRKIKEGRIYSAIDGVISFQNVYRTIEHKAAETMSFGQAKAKLGLHFEDKLVDSLNNSQNFELWKNKSKIAVGYLYPLFSDVMNVINLLPDNVISLSATADIPKLPSGGTPKTDVLLEVKTNQGREMFTFSCKRSTEKQVSVHEYTAETFSKVLNPDDDLLKKLLVEFQTVGGVKAMKPESVKQLEDKLRIYNNRLSRWVLGGNYGEGNPYTQWASYIVSVNENNNCYRILSVDDYIVKCNEQGVEGQLGTLFQWTYPSGGKGKRIQLKGKLI